MLICSFTVLFLSAWWQRCYWWLQNRTLQIFLAWTMESDPPKTVKSWLKMYEVRPLMRPWPVITESPGNFSCRKQNSISSQKYMRRKNHVVIGFVSNFFASQIIRVLKVLHACKGSGSLTFNYQPFEKHWSWVLEKYHPKGSKVCRTNCHVSLEPAIDIYLGHAEVSAGMFHEHVVLDEGAGVAQNFNALTSSQLALYKRF